MTASTDIVVDLLRNQVKKENQEEKNPSHPKQVAQIPSNMFIKSTSFKSSLKLKHPSLLSKQELEELKLKNERILGNPYLVKSLPDKGKRLMNQSREIESLLQTLCLAEKIETLELNSSTATSEEAVVKSKITPKTKRKETERSTIQMLSWEDTVQLESQRCELEQAGLLDDESKSIAKAARHKTFTKKFVILETETYRDSSYGRDDDFSDDE